MFEQKFTSALSSFNEEEQQVAQSIRREHSFERIKEMAENDFSTFREIIKKNLIEIHKIFNTIFDNQFKELGNPVSFDYDDLYRYYYNQIKELLTEVPPTVESLKKVLSDYAAPFYANGIHVAIQDREHYLEYLEDSLEKEKEIKGLINLQKELICYLETLNSENDWKLKVNNLVISNLDMIIERFSIQKYPIFSALERQNLEKEFKDYYLKKEEIEKNREKNKKTIAVCQSYFQKHCIRVEGVWSTFLKKSDYEDLVIFYQEMEQNSLEILESINLGLESDAHTKVFNLSKKQLGKKKDVVRYFQDSKQIDRTTEYFKYLEDKIEEYYKKQEDSLKSNFKSKISLYIPYDRFMNFDELEKMLNFYPFLSRFETLLFDSYKSETVFSLLSYLTSQADKEDINKIKQKTLIQIYNKVFGIIDDCECLDMKVTSEQLDKAITYSNVTQKIENVKDVSEEEILDVAFEPIKKKIKIYEN